MKVALVIPIHPPNYCYIYHLLRVFEYYQVYIDIFLVFSSEDDYTAFNQKDKIKKIVTPRLNTNSIVTYKKFYALEQLKDDKRYDYFIVCDSEITIIPENFHEPNILYKIEQIYNNKLIYAGDTAGYIIATTITKTCCDLFPDKLDILEKLTNNYNLYFWWSDLPVYKREHLSHFFSVINYSNIVYRHFDHIIYSCYLLLYHDFTIINTTPITSRPWSLERYYYPDIDKLNNLKSRKYGFSYISKLLYFSNTAFVVNEGSFLIYHVDDNTRV